MTAKKGKGKELQIAIKNREDKQIEKIANEVLLRGS